MYEAKARVLNTLRKNIFYLRKRVARLSLEELAEKTGVAMALIQRMESWSIDGENNLNPTLDSFAQIAEFFSISVGELISVDLEAKDFERKISRGVKGVDDACCNICQQTSDEMN